MLMIDSFKKNLPTPIPGINVNSNKKAVRICEQLLVVFQGF
jgi:hypothetical protein